MEYTFTLKYQLAADDRDADALVERLPLAGRKLLVVLTGSLMLWACGMFLVGGWKQMQIILGNSDPVLGISYGWLYCVAIVFGGGMALAIANLWKPYQAMKEIWRASARPDKVDDAEVPGWLPLWWFLWLAFSITSNFAGRNSMKANTPEAEMDAALASITSITYDSDTGKVMSITYADPAAQVE